MDNVKKQIPNELRQGSWAEVTKSAPCVICGKSDWCSTDGSFTVCRRVESAGGKHKQDRSGGDYWVYRLKDAPAPNNDTPDVRGGDDVAKAGAETLGSVYSEFLKMLSLSKFHAENLAHRGLSSEEIDRRGYRTMPTRQRARLVGQLQERFGIDTCLAVPGLHMQAHGDRSWLNIAGSPGLIIPVRDFNNYVVALKIRLDKPGDGPKYLYVSSSKHGGPTPGSPIHIPIFDDETSIVRLTEGELKADIATSLSGILTLGLPGVSIFRPALPILKAIGAEVVRLAFDSDARNKRHVAQALDGTARALDMEGFTVELEVWG